MLSLSIICFILVHFTISGQADTDSLKLPEVIHPNEVTSKTSSFNDFQLITQNVTASTSGSPMVNTPLTLSHSRAELSREPLARFDQLQEVQSKSRQLAIAAFSFETGDIDQNWRTMVETTSLQAFEGRWRLMAKRSDSIDHILEALGISPFKRRIMATFEGITDINVNQLNQKVYFRTSLPAGRSVAASIVLDGTQFAYEEPETGRWTSRAIFSKGRLAQYRQGTKGVMYDVRAVFKTHPQGLSGGPVMLFRWTFTPTGSSTPLVANRWLRLD